MHKTSRASVGRPPTFDAPRETILREAAKLFAENGFEGTSLQNVASAVGITKAALYHYFATKQEMYDAIVIDILQRLYAYVLEHVEKDAPHETRLKQLMVAHASFFEDNYTQFVTLLHGIAGLQRPISSKEAHVRDEYERFVRRLIADGSKDGSFTKGQVEISAKAVLSLLNWMSRWYRPEGDRRASEFAEEYFELLWYGLKPRTAE